SPAASIAARPHADPATVACVVGSLALHALVLCLLDAVPDEYGGCLRSPEVELLPMASTGEANAAPASDADGELPGSVAVGAGATAARESASAAGHDAGLRGLRDDAIAAARRAGLLGARDAIAGAVAALTSEQLAGGFDGSAVYGGDGGATAWGGHA